MEVSSKLQLLETMKTEDTFNTKPDYVDLVKLVRSIQRAEGNIDCYRRGRQQCDRMSCDWRAYCLKEAERTSKVGSGSQEHKLAANPKQGQDSLYQKPEL